MNILNFFLRLLGDEGTIGERVAQEVSAGLAPIGGYLRRASIGVVIILVSAAAWLGGIVGMILALFFYLANLGNYVVPALMTVVASWIIALLLIAIGFWLVRRPR